MKALIFLAACAAPTDVSGAATVSFDGTEIAHASATFDIGQAGVDVQLYTAPANTPCDELYEYVIIGSLHLYPAPVGPPYDTVQLIAENQAQLANGGPIDDGEVDVYTVGPDAISARIRGLDGFGRRDVLSFYARPCSQ